MTIQLADKIPAGGAQPWFNESLPFSDYLAGNYFQPSVYYSAITANTVPANFISYMPFVPRKTHTFTGIAIYNSTTSDSGDKIRMGIYDSTDGAPDSLLVDGGEITLDATAALRVSAISQELIKDTLYYLAFINDAASTIFVISVTAFTVPYLPGSFGFPDGGWGANIKGSSYTESYTYGALPASATPLFTAGVVSYLPFILLKG